MTSRLARALAGPSRGIEGGRSAPFVIPRVSAPVSAAAEDGHRLRNHVHNRAEDVRKRSPTIAANPPRAIPTRFDACVSRGIEGGGGATPRQLPCYTRGMLADAP